MFHKQSTKNLNAHLGRINIKLHCLLLCLSHFASDCMVHLLQLLNPSVNVWHI